MKFKVLDPREPGPGWVNTGIRGPQLILSLSLLLYLHLLQLFLQLNFYSCLFFIGTALFSPWCNCEVEAGGFESHLATRLGGRTRVGMVAAADEGGESICGRGQAKELGKGGGPGAGSAQSRGRLGELVAQLFFVAFYFIWVHIIFIKECGSGLTSSLNSIKC